MRQIRSAGAAVTLLLAGTLVGCSATRPVLYPNPHYEFVGATAAEADVEECMAFAEEHGHEPDQSDEVARKTAVGGAVGAAGGAAVGAVFGSAGRGAAAGAVGGAVGSLRSGLMSSNQPEPVFKRFVEQCLADRGYRPIGWE